MKNQKVLIVICGFHYLCQTILSKKGSCASLAGGVRKMLSWHSLLIFVLSNGHLYYRNTQFLFWQCHTMPLNMILVVYVIPCVLPYDFNKLTILYIHVGLHISFISITNKSVMTFFLSIKYLSVLPYNKQIQQILPFDFVENQKTISACLTSK